MLLHATITSERGKPVTKSGNHHVDIVIQDENRQKIFSVYITAQGTYKLRMHNSLINIDDIPM